MKKLIILTTVAILLVGIVVFLYTRNSGEVPTLSPTPTPTPTTEGMPMPLPTDVPAQPGFIKEISYSDNGFSPSILTISVGESVRFFNEGNRLLMWPASAVHPTHKAYPGTDIAKCGTSSQNGMFDACKGYGTGESWEFRFNEQGTWKYHNHLQPTHFGTIIVE